MNNLRRISVFLGVCALLIVFSVGYKGNDILARAIVLGLGVDSCPDGVCVTAEIVSPGNGGEQVGMFTKTVSATGKTVAEALQQISVKSGKEASLGQVVLIVYGQDIIQGDFSDTADFFIRSDSCKESSIVCCCEGSAQQLLNNGDALSQSVSLALADKLKGLAKEVAIPASDLLNFARSQKELYKTGFLNYVKFQSSPNSSTVNPEQPQGYFDCSRIAVFRQNSLVGILSEEETQGFALLCDSVSGNMFSVQEEGKYSTLRANSKSVDTVQKEGTVTMSVSMQVKFARTDSFGAGGMFTAKTQTVPENLLQQAKEQSLQLATLFLKKQVEWEFDLVKIHEIFRQKYGNVSEIVNLPMKDIPVILKVDVKEK